MLNWQIVVTAPRERLGAHRGLKAVPRLDGVEGAGEDRAIDERAVFAESVESAAWYASGPYAVRIQSRGALITAPLILGDVAGRDP